MNSPNRDNLFTKVERFIVHILLIVLLLISAIKLVKTEAEEFLRKVPPQIDYPRERGASTREPRLFPSTAAPPVIQPAKPKELWGGRRCDTPPYRTVQEVAALGRPSVTERCR
jgi:hypothetical protein